jgi:exonuclease SbcC
VIRSISVRDFESHRNTTLDLSPGLNVLVGPSDAGKSAIFRALSWVLRNRPLGDFMIPLFWASKEGTEVTIETTDGCAVVKRKHKGANEYLVDGKLLTGFGTDVPREVEEALRMDEVNFQPQIALPFLMFDSPGERARVLNRVAGLDAIDRTLANADAGLRKHRRGAEEKRERLAALQRDLDRYKDLDEREAEVLQAEGLTSGVKEARDRSTVLKSCVTRAEELTPRIEECRGLLAAGHSVREAERIAKNVTEIASRIDLLRGRIRALDVISSKLRGLESLRGAGETLEKAGASAKTLRDEKSKIEALQRAIRNVEEIDERLRRTRSECEEIAARLPRKCPTCGQALRV